MHNLNKFKIFTIIFICMFIFVVAAIYTNTKEASENKMKNNQQNKEQKTDMVSNSGSANNSEIEHLSMRIDELSQRINEINGNPEEMDNNRMKCNIQGLIDGDHIEELSPETSIQEAKINGREIVLICTF